jgi:hypothetical protein
MRTLPLVVMGVLCGGGAAAAPETSAPGNPDTIHVNAMRDPEVRKYAAIVAGLDAFDRHHGMAPAVEILRFRIEPRSGKAADLASDARPILVRLEGDNDFVLPLPIDANNDVVVPRSALALDASSEMTLNRKRRDYRIAPRVRTPGLPENVRRLGDMRLECKVWVAIAKEEIGLMLTMTVNSILMTRDWCSFFDKQRAGFSFTTSGRVAQAILYEGNLSRALEFEGRSIRVPLHDPAWSDEALIDITFEAPTETAGETPRTAP